MKKLVLPKRILGVFIFLCVFSMISMISVNAAEKEKQRCEEVLSDEAVKRYGLTFEPKNAKQKKFVIKMEPKNSNPTLLSKLNKIKFKVTSINGQPYSGTDTLSVKDKLVLDAKFDANNTIVIDLESTKTKVDTGFCKGDGKIHFTLTYKKGGEAFYTKVDIDTSELDGYQGKLTTNNEIDCDHPKNEIDDIFCSAKQKVFQQQPKAKNSNSSINFENKFNGWLSKKNGNYGLNWTTHEKKATFKCDYQNAYTVDDLKGDNYYKPENKSYLYGSGSYEIPFKYTYHYDPIRKEEVNVSCKVACEEAVTVEYGPPIASKAGLCFEYKIKVTSVVSCKMTDEPDQPKKDYSYCTPTPICTNNRGWVGNQGGPNEEFDNCIKDCDGGKYTDKCNNKCYEEVYSTKDTVNMTSSLHLAAIEKMASKKKKTSTPTSKEFKVPAQHKAGEFSLASCQEENKAYGGCYVNNDGTIEWKANYVGAPGRWYVTNPHKDLSEYVVGSDGIYRHKYEDGSICSDTCWWSGCEDATYLNPGFAKKDWENNKNIYKEAMKQCKAAASCTTTTATFTISVDYKHNTKEAKDVPATIDFPYDKNIDSLNSNGTNTLDNKNTTFLDHDGCYKSVNNERWYRAEWSFPGTWINNKTGEITYKPIDGNGWQTLQNKFCLPIDALNVNEPWWNYYYAKINKNKIPSTLDSSYSETCGNTYTPIYNPSDKNSKFTPIWNIRGEAVDFGFFNWNINVKCFYALNSNPTNVSDSSTQKDKCTIGEGPEVKTNYRIRSVDLNNLFPDTEGANLTNKTTSGRIPGFNWSKYATITPTKNSSYNSNPFAYMGKVQSLGYNVYSDANLDYEFKLTKDVLSNLRKRTKEAGKNYTEFKGNVNFENGVSHYKSSEIRELISDRKTPENANINCNNMINWHTMECDGE